MPVTYVDHRLGTNESGSQRGAARDKPIQQLLHPHQQHHQQHQLQLEHQLQHQHRHHPQEQQQQQQPRQQQQQQQQRPQQQQQLLPPAAVVKRSNTTTMDDLVIRPFREVVERGKEAAEKAAEAADEDIEVGEKMARAARAIVREGERALKKIVPLWNEERGDVGDALKNTMTEHGSISEKQRTLETLLYDFEDYMDVDSFEEERFVELQVATKSLALVVIETIRKLAIEPPKMERGSMFPPLPPLPSHIKTDASSIRSVPRPTSKGKESHPLSMRPKQPIHGRRPRPEARGGVYSPPPPSLPMEASSPPPPLPQPPRLPSLPLSPTQTLTFYQEADDEVGLGLRTRTRSPQLNSPPPPPMTAAAASPPQPQFQHQHQHQHHQLRQRPSLQNIHVERSNRIMNTANFPNIPPPPPSSSSSNMNQTPVVRDSNYFPSPQEAAYYPQTSSYCETPQAVSPLTPLSPLNDSFPVSMSEPSMTFDAISPMASKRASTFSNATVITSYTSSTGKSQPGSSMLGPRFPRNGSFPSALADRYPIEESGLSSLSSAHSVILEDQASSDTASRVATGGFPAWRDVEMGIGLTSSLMQLGGFCEGAKGFRSGGHWDGVIRYGAQSGSSGANGYSYDLLFSAPQPVMAEPLARCIHCEYSHKYSQMSEDVDRNPKANLVSEGVRFRRRFLYKSHIPTKDKGKAYYACLFCEHDASTVREDDATVFASITQLARHLSRHPHPLPAVPGLTVIYGRVGPEHPQAQDYDINLINEPEPEIDTTPTPTTLAYLPVAIGIKDHTALPNERKLTGPDSGTPALQFMAGARILGVEFPAKWGGKWCQGWHDGRFGAFPAKTAQLEAPKRMRTGPNTASRRSGTTKWKWDPKAIGPLAVSPAWLAFDKGEEISCLDWDDPDAWYWSGTNSKGKFGIFPSSHMKIESIQDGSLAEPGSRPPSSGKKAGMKPGRFFGIRRMSTATNSTGSSH